jgi:hypothetical protein
VALEVKKFEAGFELWKARTGADLKAVFEAPTSVAESRNGWRMENAILRCFLGGSINSGDVGREEDI